MWVVFSVCLNFNEAIFKRKNLFSEHIVPQGIYNKLKTFYNWETLNYLMKKPTNTYMYIKKLGNKLHIYVYIT